MKFTKKKAKEIAKEHSIEGEEYLIDSFAEVCSYLSGFPKGLSWGTGEKPSLKTDEGLKVLAKRYFDAYRKSDFPVEPTTVPDEMVSVIMEKAYGYSADECERIKKEHQHSMSAENCVGNLLERYLDSKLQKSNWHWCCGDFVRAIDFLGKDKDNNWLALQIKNRSNSENSSSSAIREGTTIQKWFRSFSKDTQGGRTSFTNWDNLPSLMEGYDLSEDDFKAFVSNYIKANKP